MDTQQFRSHLSDSQQFRSQQFRVRQIVSQLTYKTFVRHQYVPDISCFLNDIITKRYPPWLYRSQTTAFAKDEKNAAFMFMGLYLDGIVRKMVSNIAPVDWGEKDLRPLQDLPDYLIHPDVNWKDTVKSYFSHLAEYHKKDPNTIATSENLNAWFGFLGLLNKNLPRMVSKDLILFNTEFTVSKNGYNLSGHPDIVDGDTVIDIKTSQSFKSIAEETYLQLFAYVALMRENGMNITHMAVLLPLQTQLIRLNVSNWDSKPFLNYLFKAIEILSYIPNQLYISPLPENVGCTVGKENYIEYTKMKPNSGWPEVIDHLILEMETKDPIQIMLTGRQNIDVTLNDSQMAHINQMVTEYNLPLYVHAAYTINLAKNDHSLRGAKDALLSSNAIAARGTVIHTGKPVELSKEEGMDNMIKNLKVALQSATEQCPLLLETPVGAGTELGDTIEEFSEIYSHFDKEERKRFKICIDTCHVFCAGYDPYEYILRWDQLQGYQSIGLIHFNDSRKTFGCRCDGHAQYGAGTIGAKILSRVALWCNSRGIAMVTE